MRKHILSIATLVLVLGVLASGPSTMAQSTLPRLTIDDVIGSDAVGARMPLTSSNGHYWSNGSPTSITYDPASGTIYAANHESYVAEIRLPNPMVHSANIDALPYVEIVNGQGFYDPIEGQHYEADNNDPNHLSSLWGLLAMPDRLYGTHSISYDANNNQVKSHWSRPKTLATSGDVKGLDQFWDGNGAGLSATQYSGFTSGYLFRVPPEWQSAFEGRTIGSGQCCQSIITRNSYGPAAGVFYPSQIGSGDPEPHSWKPLVYYSGAHPTLGCWAEPNPDYPAPGTDPFRGCQHEYFGYTTSVRAAVMINNTRTMAFFGRQGTGTPCYGNGTSNQALHDQTIDGEHYCYDPTNNDKANHQYPYRYFIWLYDINDLVQAYNGEIPPYEVEPYDGAYFTFPVAAPETGGEGRVNITGADYDAATRSLYLVQANIDKIQPCCNVAALLWKFTVNIPETSGEVDSASIAFDKTSPQPPNTTIRFTATATGGVTPYQYQWKVFDGATWNPQAWGTSNIFDWTPTTAGNGYKVAVDVRSAGSAGSAEASDEEPFVISGSSTVTSVSLVHDLASPKPVNTTITWTGGGNGGVGPLQFKFWVQDPTGTWTVTQGWSTQNTYVWTPTTAGSYSIAVWVRSAGNSEDYFEQSTQDWYTITSP